MAPPRHCADSCHTGGAGARACACRSNSGRSSLVVSRRTGSHGGGEGDGLGGGQEGGCPALHTQPASAAAPATDGADWLLTANVQEGHGGGEFGPEDPNKPAFVASTGLTSDGASPHARAAGRPGVSRISPCQAGAGARRNCRPSARPAASTTPHPLRAACNGQLGVARRWLLGRGGAQMPPCCPSTDRWHIACPHPPQRLPRCCWCTAATSWRRRTSPSGSCLWSRCGCGGVPQAGSLKGSTRHMLPASTGRALVATHARAGPPAHLWLWPASRTARRYGRAGAAGAVAPLSAEGFTRRTTLAPRPLLRPRTTPRSP